MFTLSFLFQSPTSFPIFLPPSTLPIMTHLTHLIYPAVLHPLLMCSIYLPSPFTWQPAVHPRKPSDQSRVSAGNRSHSRWIKQTGVQCKARSINKIVETEVQAKGHQRLSGPNTMAADKQSQNATRTTAYDKATFTAKAGRFHLEKEYNKQYLLNPALQMPSLPEGNRLHLPPALQILCSVISLHFSGFQSM